ncbi:MAG: hypothetical protein RSG77_24800 [Hafnia sp.]|uniref:Uncharacterized protein n=1 Tax=Citrobacter meridianamericanus TaxID=2894201 RepID=A0ABT1B7D7_9ENTR|nr:hypothetical protein [Citrobacter meridianamericanus]MCO5781777.1 hypothetical protein [Citrobacter meridianamericanus]
MNQKIIAAHNKIKPDGLHMWPLQKFNFDAKYMKRGDVFRVTIDIPASQISDKRDVRALFGDADCKLIPTITFIDNEK